MRRGRAGRCRKRHKIRQTLQTIVKGDDSCGKLRKWMVSQSSKADFGDTLDLVPFNFPDTGRGLKTKKSISPGTVIISIPLSLLVTTSTVLNSPVGLLVKRWKVVFTPQQLLSLFLLTELDKGEHSQWYLFISSLPSDYTLPHYFSTEELNVLPLHVLLAAQQMIQRCRHAHRQVAKFIAVHWKDHEHLTSWEKFRWAWCTVNSRAVFVETEAGVEGFVDLSMKSENNVALCPYLDLLNHASTARMQAGLNQATRKYEIVTEDAYEPHDQVFIKYGPHDNTALFLHYGFTLPFNIHNSFIFSVDDFIPLCKRFQVVCWDKKQEVLVKHELNRELSCTMEGVSWNLMCALKILSMNWDQLQKSERAVMGEELSPAVELSARRMAQHLIRQALAKSQAQLAKLLPGEALSPHLSIAHTLLMDEVNILTVSLQALT
ncbi:SET domain-containing protein 4-like [Babylonia areolata]|uniref:SET domain-containing protein 4-like n=1 Tax=Babylonia areolata TaxID=304850 RepID=UPI003FCF7B48